MTWKAPTKMVGNGNGDSARARRNYRHPSGVVAGSLGLLLIIVRGFLERDPDLKWMWAGGALLIAWCAWTCRMTITEEAVVVQNFWIPKTYRWHEIRTARMVTPRFRDPVLQIEMRDHRTVRVWAVSIVQGLGANYCDGARRQLLADLKEAPRRG